MRPWGSSRPEYVLVGNVPTTDGQGTPGAGAIQVLNLNGQLVATLTDSTFLDGPWALDGGERAPGRAPTLFVSNVLNGTW